MLTLWPWDHKYGSSIKAITFVLFIALLLINSWPMLGYATQVHHGIAIDTNVEERHESIQHALKDLHAATRMPYCNCLSGVPEVPLLENFTQPIIFIFTSSMSLKVP